MKRVVPSLLTVALVSACGPTTEPVDLYVAAIDFTSAPGSDNRLDYEISGDDFEDPHVAVGDRVFAVEDERPEVNVDEGRSLMATFDEPAPYAGRAPIRMLATFGAVPGVQADEVEFSVTGTLRSQTGSYDFAVLEEAGVAALGAPVELVSDDLPARVDLYTLELRWSVAPVGCSAGCTGRSEFVTRHVIPRMWRQPIEQAPRYRDTLVWSAKFAAGEWPETEEGELGIAHAMLDGFATLDEEGKSYGAFPRPTYDGTVQAVDVWLDFPRSACGELKHALQAMIEYQGVDAQWGVLEFLSTGADRFSQYETYEVPALGREPQVWYQTNHAFTVVKGRVFDPTYNGYADTVDDYEDWLFRRFCYGQAEPCRTAGDWCNYPPEDDIRCVDNPPGPDPSLGFVFYSGDNYL